MRSTSRRTRSVSSTISWASGASSALAPDLSSWAAPRIAGQRVLDFVRQHAAEADDGAQARGLVLHAALDAQAMLDGERQQYRAVAQRGRCPVGFEGRQAEEADVHAAFPDAGIFLDRAVQPAETNAEPGGSAA